MESLLLVFLPLLTKVKIMQTLKRRDALGLTALILNVPNGANSSLHVSLLFQVFQTIPRKFAFSGCRDVLHKNEITNILPSLSFCFPVLGCLTVFFSCGIFHYTEFRNSIVS